MKIFYEHDQMAWTILGILAFIMIAITLTFVFADAERESMAVIGTMFAILTLVGILFYRARITINSEKVRFRFGPGLISKSISISEIESCKPVRQSILNGFGIRLTRHGWLYNVSGLDAVEFKLRSGKKIRFGTDEPDRLCAAIKRVLASNMEKRDA